MIAQIKAISNGAQIKEDESFKIPPDLRKSKVDQVMAMLEREYVFRYLRAALFQSKQTYTDMMPPQIGTGRRGTKEARKAEHCDLLIPVRRKPSPVYLVE